MIGDDFREVCGLGSLRNNGSGVWDMLEQRSVGKKRTSRDKDDARVRPAITREISNRYGAAVFKHDVEDKDFWFRIADMCNCSVLAGYDIYLVSLALQMTGPNLR